MTDQAEPGRAGGYDPVFFAGLFAVEDRHFWFRARNQVISALTSQAVAQLSPGYRVLEVGCGDGNVLRFGSDPKEDQPIGEWFDMHGRSWTRSPDGGWTLIELG